MLRVPKMLVGELLNSGELPIRAVESTQILCKFPEEHAWEEGPYGFVNRHIAAQAESPLRQENRHLSAGKVSRIKCKQALNCTRGRSPNF